MLKLKDSFYQPVEKSMLDFFYRALYEPILEVLKAPEAKLNDVSALREAIRSGRIRYHEFGTIPGKLPEGMFTGQFSAAISRELAGFAHFDKRAHVWRGNPPPDIKGVAIVADSKRRTLVKELQRSLDEAAGKIDEAIATLSFGSDLPLFAMDQDIRRDLYDIGILPELTPAAEECLRKNYSESQTLNIKNWMPDQIVRLREMVKQIQTSGDKVSIQDAIKAEWGTTAAKAGFLARQETSLFFSKLGLDRAADAGVRRYRWSTSHDERVRNEQTRRHWYNHEYLDGKIIDFDKPPVVDLKTGRRAHAGEDFNCRCGKIWVLD